MLDATHFRLRAARAREMAQSGDDIRLSRMLLEVALDLDAEAEAIEAEVTTERRGLARLRPARTEQEALLHVAGIEGGGVPAHILNLSRGGARVRVDWPQKAGNNVTLELPHHGLHLDGTILRVRGSEAVMVFEPAATADLGLSRLLQADTAPETATA
jgi:hypothetical protein